MSSEKALNVIILILLILLLIILFVYDLDSCASCRFDYKGSRINGNQFMNIYSNECLSNTLTVDVNNLNLSKN